MLLVWHYEERKISVSEEEKLQSLAKQKIKEKGMGKTAGRRKVREKTLI